MSKELRLVIQDYCLLNRIPYSKQIVATEQERNPKTGNFVFLITGAGLIPKRYEQERIDLTPYSENKSLELTGNNGVIDPNVMNKIGLASWFNRQTNLNMLPSDIGQFLIKDDAVVVVGSSNSMRFKHSFSMRYK